MTKLVFATNNRHKVDEVKHKLNGLCSIQTLSEIGCREDIPETADTLEGNALQKARYLYEKYGCNCFADDTGLEVEALDNAPGVYSARYAGEAKNPDENMKKLLCELSGKTNRKARFRTVIALILDGKEYLFEGIVDGRILEERQGNEGFGYDPIFLPAGYEKSFAQLSMTEKNNISHRGRAVEKLLAFLSEKGK
ncbi:MAG: non-canonical purine NTP diphosphatase [Prevotellaceae bacterium]|jgi:XTP/dITP diphosphohydrolase|nr:non-canonical purine NTP diphosphatase [Prevotellaceae bacterium]